MRIKVWGKFVIIYVLFAFVSLFALAALVPVMTEKAIVENDAERMYREATVISSEYVDRYYDGEINEKTLQKELEPVCTYLDSSIWLVDFNGKILMSAGNSYTAAPPASINEFNALDITAGKYAIGNFYGTFDKKVLTVCVPITMGLRTSGYVLIHMPVESKSTLKSKIEGSMVIAFIIVLILSLSILAAYFYFVDMPLNRILKASQEYAKGNLSYQIPIDTNDEIGMLSASLNDMSGKLNELEDTQRKFVANVSHDFRSPLTSIKGYSEAIADGTIPPEHMKKYLDIIIFETDRLTDLTRDLLTLSDLDMKGMSLKIENFNINEMIKTTAVSFQGRCLEHKIEIDLVLADYESIVNADRAKIQQVFYNLLDNAIKFSNDDSIVTVETTNQGNKLLVSIKDDGIGIPRDSIDKIWDRFYKTDQSRGKDKKGTGLGLAIVKDIIKAHDETINVVSTEGVGTEFIFTLPRVIK